MSTRLEGTATGAVQHGIAGDLVPVDSWPAETVARLAADAAVLMGRYPQARSALLPLLHLVQSEEGFVSPQGIEFCAAQLGLTTAEVSAVATFYTMYKRRPVGDYHVGVCTNTLCAIMGGDEIFAALREHLDVGNDETTADGRITLEHIECNAACDYAPVMTVNWEFFDNQTPSSARDLVDALRAGGPVTATRGPVLCTFKEQERLLAGFYDGRADEGVGAGPASLLGLSLLAENDQRPAAGSDAPDPAASSASPAPATGEPLTTGYGVEGGPSGSDAPLATSESDPANADSPVRDHDTPLEPAPTKAATRRRTRPSQRSNEPAAGTEPPTAAPDPSARDEGTHA